MIEAIVLAAGKGTRMRSALPKVMHPIGGKPMLEHILETARQIEAQKIHLVLGHGSDMVEKQVVGADICSVMQTHQLGTGHAVMQAVPNLDETSTALILFGDVPLITASTLQLLLQKVGETSMALLTVRLYDPTGYGRIIRNQEDAVVEIVEEKDANADQLRIKEVNTGIMAVKTSDLKRWLPKLSNENAQGEYYLPDIIAMAVTEGKLVNAVVAEDEAEVMGVNNRQQQAHLERHYQRLQAQQLMIDGTTILDPNRFDLRGNMVTGEDCVIDVNCVFEGQISLGNSVTIGPNCMIKDTTILDGAQINANSVIEGATIGPSCAVGPFARIRPGSVLEEGSRVGNFVETKKAFIGRGSKINHLSYIGDAHVGRDVNIGAGTITCNYDGANKFKTTIEDDVFVGSNTALVAPVKLEKGSTVGAGSTITQDVKARQLAVARQKQRNIDDWPRPKKS